ncbi:MAG: ABC transporter permease [Clostridia bacterium]|nr:ABC transporter permease [Clostridia bacterium]
MSFTNFFRIIRESFTNLSRNRVLTITSIFTVFLTLVLIGVFGLFLLNLSYNASSLDELLEVKIFIVTEADIDTINAFNERLVLDSRIATIEYVSKEEAFESTKELFDEDLLDLGLGADFLPASFVVTLNNYDDVDYFVAEVREMPEVYKVVYHKDSFNFTSNYSKWIRMISGVLGAILAFLAVLLISNTIRLTVYSRNDEVVIMKFIGATESRIKIPFVIEGGLIGCIGAIISFIVTGLVYSKLYSAFASTSGEEMFLTGLRMAPLKETLLMIFFGYMVLGVLLGVLGSLMAIRRHLKV